MGYKIDHDTRQKIVTVIENGSSLYTACNFARIPYKPLKSAFVHVESLLDDPNYNAEDLTCEELTIVEFYQDVNAAKARSEQLLITTVRTAANSDWRAADRALQVLNPDEWGVKGNPRANPRNTKNETPPSPGQAANPFSSSARMDLKLLTADELEILEYIVKKATGLDAEPPRLLIHTRQQLTAINE